MNKQTTYSLQYYNEGAGVWRGAGFTSDSKELVQAKMKEDYSNCGGTVSFRILSTIA